jgi:hypothetical protein
MTERTAKATTMTVNSKSRMNFRRRRRILWPLLLFSTCIRVQAFAPLARHKRPVSLASAASRTWDQTRHKLVYYGEEEEDPSPPPPKERIKTKPMPITNYNALEICQTYDRRPFQVGWRMNAVGLPLLGKSEM